MNNHDSLNSRTQEPDIRQPAPAASASPAPADPQEQNRRDDRKAMRRFIPLLIGSFLLGLLGGMAVFRVKRLMEQENDVNPAVLFQNAQLSLGIYACYLSLIVSIVMTLVNFLFYQAGKKAILDLDTEDECFSENSDRWMNKALLSVSIHTVLSWLLFAFGFYCIDMREYTDTNFIAMLLCLIGFLLSSVSTSVMQQKIINFTKQLNPEKKGSVFDPKFQSKWLESCDEAERFYIYKCAFQAYKTLQIVCLVLVIVLLMAGMAFPIGILPITCVCFIWGVMTTVYTLTAMKVTAPPTTPIT